MYFTEQNIGKFDFKKLQKQATKILHTKGGKLMMAAGAVATVVPVVGWIAGPIISAGGAELDKAQKAKLAAKLAQKKEAELLQAKQDLETGNLTDKEYEETVKGELETAAQEVRAETVKKIQVKDKKAAAAKPNSSVMIGGVAAAAALIFLTMRK